MSVTREVETQLEAKLNTEGDTVKIKQETCRLRNTDLRLRPGKKQTWKQKREFEKNDITGCRARDREICVI